MFNKIWNWIQENIKNNKAITIYTEPQLMDTVMDIVDDVYKQKYNKFIRSCGKRNITKIAIAVIANQAKGTVMLIMRSWSLCFIGVLFQQTYKKKQYTKH